LGPPRFRSFPYTTLFRSMAIGRTFRESFQKALRSLETGSHGFESPLGKLPGAAYGAEELDTIRDGIRRPTTNRLYWVAEGFRAAVRQSTRLNSSHLKLSY